MNATPHPNRSNVCDSGLARKLFMKFLLVLGVYALIACSPRKEVSLFEKRGVKFVYLIDSGKGFGADEIKVDITGENIGKFEISQDLLIQIASAQPIDSYGDMYDGFALPSTIVFVGNNNEVIAGGLIYYRIRLKKSFVQFREFTAGDGSQIILHEVVRRGAQQNADGLVIDGNYEKQLKAVANSKVTEHK